MTTKEDWNVCPSEILCMIFEYLDITALSTCMCVNSRWKDITKHILEQRKLWGLIVKVEISNEGATFLQKSKLNCRQLYRNASLWNYVKSAHINHVYTYELNDVKKINVFDGKLILLDGSSASCYDMNTFNKVSEIKCIDMEESENLIAEFTLIDDNMKKFSLYNKTKLDGLNRPKEIISLLEIRLMKLYHNSCFILSTENILSVLEYTPDKCSLQFLGRCYIGDYDSIINIFIWKDPILKNGKWLTYRSIFLTSRFGTVWCYHFHPQHQVTDLVIHKVHKFDIPNNVSRCEWLMFSKLSTVIAVTHNDNNERVTVHNDAFSGTTLLQCAELTSVMPHDHVLLLGYNDGTVEIRLSKKNTRNWNLAHSFKIQQFINDDDCAIVSLNVYEIEDSHILVVGTRIRVFQLLLTYPQNILSCV